MSLVDVKWASSLNKTTRRDSKSQITMEKREISTYRPPMSDVFHETKYMI